MREVAEKYGCEDPAKVLKCLKRILSAGMNVALPPGEANDEEEEVEEEEIDLNDRNGGETSSSSSSRTTKISAKDLEVVRQCARKIIESTRKEGFKGEGAFSSSVFLDASNSETEKDVRRTILDERDVILAHSLHRAAKQAGPGVHKIVGVVGSGHVPGIKRIFTRLNDTSKQSESDVLISMLAKRRGTTCARRILERVPTGRGRSGPGSRYGTVCHSLWWVRISQLQETSGCSSSIGNVFRCNLRCRSRRRERSRQGWSAR